MKSRKNIFENPLFKTKITSANVKTKESILGYFIGPFLAFLTNAIFGAYLNRYYTDIIGITDSSFGLFATILPIVSVIFVVFGNLFVGRLIDKTRTSQGKARPFLLISAPLALIAIILLFYIPRGNVVLEIIGISISYNFFYAVVFPMYFTSHSALISLSTRNTKHRGKLSTFSNASMVAAVGLGASVLVPFLLQDFLFVKDGSGSIITDISFQHWRIIILIMATITFVGILLEYFFTRERITEENIKLNIVEEKIPMIKQLKSVVSKKYWWFIMIYFFLFQFGGILKNSSMTYFCDFVLVGNLSGGVAMGLVGLIGGIPTAIGMIIAWPIADKLGKRNSIIIGLIISVLGGLISFIDVTNFYIVIAGIVLKGIGSIPAMYVTLALLSDVLDHLEAKFGFRSDGVTMSIYGAIMIGMTGLANGLINTLLTTTGYDAVLGQNQPAATQNALVWSFLGIELICYSIIIILLSFLDVEKHVEEDHLTILEFQKKTVLSAGKIWINPAESLRIEQEEADRLADEARKRELRLYCKRKGLSFEEQEEKYQQKLARKKNLLEEKTQRRNHKKLKEA